MDRKFVIALSSLAGSMLLTDAHAIGLGEITLRTSLNEPLQADIQLLQLSDLSENEIRINLASPDEFSKAGVERDFLLNSLRFRLDLSDPKKPRVVVSTQQPMREPYLNFLVEVQWPSGRLLREYTLLMDLPTFNDTQDSATQGLRSASVPVAAPKESSVRQDVESAPVAPEEAAAEPVAEEVMPAPVAETQPQPADEPEQAATVLDRAPSSGGSVVVRRASRDEIENYRSSSKAPVPVAETPVEQEIEAQEAATETPPAAPAQESAAVAEDPVADEPAAEPAPDTSVSGQSASEAPAEPASEPSSVEYGPTESNDTLWKIAQRVRSEGSIHQNMVAIQRMNPEAFINGNINQLKKGKVLRLPAPSDISAISNQEAIADVGSQTSSWQAKRNEVKAPTGSQLDATGNVVPADAGTASAPDGQLKLATPGDAAAPAAKGSGKAAADPAKAALDNELAVGMEELTRVQRENQEYASRVKDLDAQVTNAERLLELQSGELASMQAKLAEEQQAKLAAEAKAKSDADAKLAAETQAKAEAVAKAEAEAKAAAELKATQDAKIAADVQAQADASVKAAAELQAKMEAETKLAAENKAAEEAKAAADKAAADAAKVAAAAEPVTQPPAEPEAGAPAVVDSTATAPESTVIPTPAPAPVVDEAPPAQPVVVQDKTTPATESTVENGLGSQLIGGVVAILLILAGLFGYRKISARRSADEDTADADYDADADEEIQHFDSTVAEADNLDDLDEEIEAASHAAAPVTAVQQPVVDVLGEADIYISFGNFEKAEAILQSAIQSESSRTDYRLKLLELYKESDNLTAFDAAYKDLIELDDDAAIAQASTMRGKLSAAASTPFAFGVAAVAAAAGVSDELDIDDLDFDAPAAATTPEPAPVADDFDLDFDLDLDMSAAAEPEAVKDDALDLQSILDAASPVEDEFDLDLNFDLDEEVASAPVVVEPAPVVVADPVDDFDLDALLDEPEAAVPAGQGEVSADDLLLDFDLDFAETPAKAQPVEESPAAKAGHDITMRRPAVQDVVPSVSAQSSADMDSLLAVAPDAADMDEELDFLTDADEAATKLDLARAYIDMGDKEGARDILEEVLEEGGPDQKAEAQQLLRTIGG